jgi:predicted house-cleaning noncanonical NTP pyrophosphatase (MazG superfamily)
MEIRDIFKGKKTNEELDERLYGENINEGESRMEFKNLLKKRKTNEDLINQLRDKMEEIPELRDVINQIVNLAIDNSKQIRIEITVKDFDNSTNTTFEKIIKR